MDVLVNDRWEEYFPRLGTEPSSSAALACTAILFPQLFLKLCKVHRKHDNN